MSFGFQHAMFERLRFNIQTMKQLLFSQKLGYDTQTHISHIIYTLYILCTCSFSVSITCITTGNSPFYAYSCVNFPFGYCCIHWEEYERFKKKKLETSLYLFFFLEPANEWNATRANILHYKYSRLIAFEYLSLV